MKETENRTNQILKEVVQIINEGHTVTICIEGRSMRPFIEGGRDITMLAPCTEIKVGTVVLAHIRPDRYVVHRITAIDGQNVTLCGDGNIAYEHCTLDDIKAYVPMLYRKGRSKPDRTDSVKWKIYSFFWVRLHPVRGYLLALHRRIWLKMFPPHRYQRGKCEHYTKYSVRKFCGEDVLMPDRDRNVNFDSIIHVSETAMFIWRCIMAAGKVDVDDIALRMTAAYDVTYEDACRDIKKCIGDWQRMGMFD